MAVCWCSQVLVLSEGRQLYFGPPGQAVDWFGNCLGYPFWRDKHGAVADWLMDLVSVGFSKPAALSGASMTTSADVARASELWHAHTQKVTSLWPHSPQELAVSQALVKLQGRAGFGTHLQTSLSAVLRY